MQAQRRDPALLRGHGRPPATPSASCCASCSPRPRFLPDEHGRLGAVELIRNELVPAPGGGLRAQATDERETIPAGLAFRAIGYRGIPLPGVPFDERSAVIPNEGGRVLDPDERRPRCPASTSSAGSSAARRA